MAASRDSTPRSRSRSSTSTASSDTTMLDAPALAPAQPRRASHPSFSARPHEPAFSLLLSLPRELRDRIYTYALVSQIPFWWPNPAPDVRHNVALGLLTASRQVYDEAAPVLYSANKFLFTHPSDCNLFRVVASPKYSALIQLVFFKLREKDLRLWTTYLGSRTQERSLKHDLPKLKSLWIFLRCGSVIPHAAPPHLAAQVQAVQHALGQQFHALQQQVQQLTQTLGSQGQANAGGQQAPGTPIIAPTVPPVPGQPPLVTYAQHIVNHAQQIQPHFQHPLAFQPHAHGFHNNPPNPSPLAVLHHHQQHHPHAMHHTAFHASLLRWEREIGLENLCLSLQETRPVEADVKIVCVMRLPKAEVLRLCRVYPEELTVDRNGDARTRFRKLHGCEVSLELSGIEVGVGS